MATHRQEGSWPWVTGSVSGELGLLLDPCPAMVRPGHGATIPDSRSQLRDCNFQDETTEKLIFNHSQLHFCVCSGSLSSLSTSIRRTHCRKFNIQNNMKVEKKERKISPLIQHLNITIVKIYSEHFPNILIGTCNIESYPFCCHMHSFLDISP